MNYRIVVILIASAAGLFGQTTLTPGVAVPFSIAPTGAVMNGKNGFVIPIPSDPIQITGSVQIATAPGPKIPVVLIYLRCGTDVGAGGNAVYDTVTAADLNGKAIFFLSRPAGGADGNCYVALQGPNDPSSPAIVGHLTVNIQPFPAGTQVTVSSVANIYLAGQPPGTRFGNLSVPSNSPPQVPVTLVPGQALNIFAAGHLAGVPPEGALGALGVSAANNLTGPTTTGAFGLSEALVSISELVGVFLADTIDSTHTPPALEYYPGDLQNTQTLYPQLQQVFAVGSGATFYGLPRVFVVPQGATRLFLASAAGGFNATGSFLASVSAAAIPPVPATTNPATISLLTDLYLVDQPAGKTVPSIFPGFSSAFLPYSAPVQVPISLTPGQTLHFRTSTVPATTVMAALGFGSPITDQNGFSAAYGGLAGVFVGNTVDPTKTPPDMDYSHIPANQKPVLQQVFYAGGLQLEGAPPADVTVPTGATRLFLGFAGGGLALAGAVTAVVTPDTPNAPTINDNGVVTNAGFIPGPVAPGSMVAIFGTNFGPVGYPTGLPLPTTLSGTQVFFNTVPAPLFYVSPTQIVAQVPFETQFSTYPLVSPSTALVTVVVNGVYSVAQTVNISPFAAGLFTTPDGNAVVIDNNTGALVTPTSPASRGDTLIIWATGLGPTVFDPASGAGAPSTASPTLFPVQVILKSPGSGAQLTPPVQYAGLAPGFVALDQINVQIPANAPTGTVILQLQSPSFPPVNPYTIGIQ
jgi:uncharacterized protein (TIGR03437 family)